MQLSFRQKQDFYYSLGQLLRAGIPVPKALQTLSRDTRGVITTLSRRMMKVIDAGGSLAEAFAKQAPVVSPIESSIMAACERAGRVDQGCDRLTVYFEALGRARGMIVRRTLYPVFVLHFAIFSTSLPRLFTEGLRAYLEHSIGTLLVVYAIVAVIWLAVETLLGLASDNVFFDGLCRAFPIAGKIRSNFSLARFCAAYEMQLSSGLTVMETLARSAEASQSAMIRRAVEGLLPAVQAGNPVGPLLGKRRVFPSDMVRAFQVGEETGQLDGELQRLTARFEETALNRVETLAEWMPRILYFAVVIYVGIQIVQFYRGMISSELKLIDE